MKKLIFVNGRFLAQRVTGVQRYALETLIALDELLDDSEHSREFTVTLLLPKGAEPPDLRNIAARVIGHGRGHLWEQCFLPLYARHGLLLSFTSTGPIAARQQVVTMHDASVYAVPQAFSWRFRAWYKLLMPLLAHRSRRTMTVSQFSRHELARYLHVDAGRLHVSGEGWQHATRIAADGEILQENGLSDRGYILAVSSLSPHKNFEVIARAVAKLPPGALRVVVAGGINERIFKDAPPATLQNLTHVGYVTDAALRALYEHAAAFVYPSTYEGFGLPPLEAFALDCPVIAADAASLPEVCRDAALYFPPHDHNRLAELMMAFVHNPELRAEQIAKGRAQLDRHSWHTAAGEHLALVREVTASA